MLRLNLKIILVVLIVITLTGCSEESEPTPIPATPTDIPTPIPPTQTLIQLTPTSIPPTLTSEPPTPSASSISYQNPKAYQVEYVVTVYNTAYDLDELRVYQPNLVEWDAQKDVQVELISPPATKLGVDQIHGNEMIYWRALNQPGAGGSQIFKIRFTLTAYETIAKIDPTEVQSYDESDSLYLLYTQSERFIESADPKIVKLADQLAGDEKNPYLIARKFYDYVIDTSTYQLLGKGLLGAKYLATTGKGECGDYSSLFIALARAKGIPARPVVGYRAVSGIDQTHVWAEFYLEPFGWIPVDPTDGQDDPTKREYYFGNMDNQRVIFNKGFNITLDPPGPGGYVAPFLQVPLWWFWGGGEGADSMRIERTNWEVTKLP